MRYPTEQRIDRNKTLTKTTGMDGKRFIDSSSSRPCTKHLNNRCLTPTQAMSKHKNDAWNERQLFKRFKKKKNHVLVIMSYKQYLHFQQIHTRGLSCTFGRLLYMNHSITTHYTMDEEREN